jgi:hypothetical protein
VGSVPIGGAVTLARGEGSPPAPAGGVVATGGYQLVAETVYGSVQPNVTDPKVGATVSKTLYAECGIVNELFRSSEANGTVTGNDCKWLDADTLSTAGVSGFIGPGIPDLRDDVSYTANGDRLTLIIKRAYEDTSRTEVLGAYTFVDEYVLYSGVGHAPEPVNDAGVPQAPAGRDPRCPASVPKNGDPCSPDPAPLECEYASDASDASERCTMFAACALDLATGDFGFQLDASPNCARSVRSDAGLPANCPYPPPLAGDPCTPGLECDYGEDCATPTSRQPSMICQNGYWAQVGGICVGGPEILLPGDF